MKYQLTITTHYTGDAKWLDQHMDILRHHYGADFTERLSQHGRSELKSTDPDGATAVSVYELNSVTG